MIVTKRLVTLCEPVAARLDDEANKSALIDALLAKYFNVQIPEEDTTAYKQRHAIIMSLPPFVYPQTIEDIKINRFDDIAEEPEPIIEPEVETATEYEPEPEVNVCDSCGQPKLTSMCLTCDL